MKNMKTAIVLGGTFPHRELILKLKTKGYYTILIDYYENPIAKVVADEHLRESTLDREKVLSIARERNASLVISTCIDQANAIACYVAEELNLPHPYSYKTAVNVTDKVLMKEIMAVNSIPTAKYFYINSIEHFRPESLTYPIIVKPADCNGSKGVRRIDKNDSNEQEYIKAALALSRNGYAIIEEFKEGKEVGVDCLIVNGKAHLLMTRERRKIDINNDGIQQIYGSYWPAPISNKQQQNLCSVAQKIADAFHLYNTPLMMQTIVSENEINVIEFAPRIGGGENYHIIKILTEYDIIEAAVNSFLGMEISLDYKKPTFYIGDNYIYARPSVFGAMRINDEAKSLIEYANIYRCAGSEIGKDISSSNRVGVFCTKEYTIKDLQEKTNKVLKHTNVYDVSGNSIMRKDIYEL